MVALLVNFAISFVILLFVKNMELIEDVKCEASQEINLRGEAN